MNNLLGKDFLISYKKYVNQNPSQCAFVNISQMGKRADITICKECPNLIFLRMYAQTFPSSYKCGGFSCSVSFGHSSRLQLNTRVQDNHPNIFRQKPHMSFLNKQKSNLFTKYQCWQFLNLQLKILQTCDTYFFY